MKFIAIIYLLLFFSTLCSDVDKCKNFNVPTQESCKNIKISEENHECCFVTFNVVVEGQEKNITKCEVYESNSVEKEKAILEGYNCTDVKIFCSSKYLYSFNYISKILMVLLFLLF